MKKRFVSQDEQPERTQLQNEGDKIGPRLTRAIARAMPKVHSTVSVHDLAEAIRAGDVKKAVSLFPNAAFRDALTPCTRIAADAYIKGGKMAMAKLRDAS